MVHAPRRHASRLAGLILCGVVMAGLLVGMAGPLSGSTPSAAAIENVTAPGSGRLDVDTQPVFVALNRLRTQSGLRTLVLHVALVESAERDACAIARGELQLSGDAARLAEAGGERENVGLVVDDDPVMGARTITDWWTRTPDHRVDRMDPGMRRYGIGACTVQERTYYVERFAS